MTAAERKEKEIVAKRLAYDRMLKRDAAYEKLGFGVGKLARRGKNGLVSFTRGTTSLPCMRAG